MIIKSEKEKKEKTEVYVVAEHKKMIVQNFVRELKGNEIDVKCIGTDFTEVNFLPNLAIHIVVCLSEELDHDFLNRFNFQLSRLDAKVRKLFHFSPFSSKIFHNYF